MNNWPHAPPHLLEKSGIYMVTCGTYQKLHHFKSPQRLQFLCDTLTTLASEAGWTLHAWAVLSNHYHFIGQSPVDPKNLATWLAKLHRVCAIHVNQLDSSPGRQVWHQFWDSHITIHTSYLARLHYVHQNPVKHGIVADAAQYPWCSAAAFEIQASKAFVKTVYSFKLDKLNIYDQF